jgi:drug/metabolite transporter (DMT)-like permease
MGAGTILATIAAARGMRLAVDRPRLRYGIIVGVFGVALPTVIAITALNHLPVGVAMLLAPLTPLLTYAFSQLLRIERFSLRRAGGVALGLAGTLMIVLPGSVLPSADLAGWVLVGMIPAVMQAAINIYAATHRPAGSTSFGLAAGMQLVAAAALAPTVAALGLFYAPQWPPGPAEAAILGHIAIAAFGALMFFEINRRAGPVVLSQVAYVVTLTGVFWGMLFFGETHTYWFWAAMVVIFAGVALVTTQRKPAV